MLRRFTVVSKASKVALLWGGLAVLTSGLASFAEASAAAKQARSRRIEVQGHRGARGARPENTLAAFAYALEVGVDTLELDIDITKDKVPVISHDPLISQELCLGPGKKPVTTQIPIYLLTLREVQAFDCGSLKNPKFPQQETVPGAQIPTLDALFTMVEQSKVAAAKTVEFNIETKSVPRYTLKIAPEPAEFVRLILAVVKRHHMLGRVTLQSFDYRTLLAAHKQAPTLRLVPLIAATLPDLPMTLKSVHGQIISPELDWITPVEVAAVHRNGGRVIPWTADKPDEWDYLIKCGVDGIITDYPKELLAYLRERHLH